MYLSDLIRDAVNAKLAETFCGKTVTIYSDNEGEVTFKCKTVEFKDDDGNCWLHFTDESDKQYTATGQGIDVWFQIKD